MKAGRPAGLLQVILHSCGAIHKVIDRLIDAGVDCLHPLQAKAAHMDAETLARDFFQYRSFRILGLRGDWGCG